MESLGCVAAMLPIAGVHIAHQVLLHVKLLAYAAALLHRSYDKPRGLCTSICLWVAGPSHVVLFARQMSGSSMNAALHGLLHGLNLFITYKSAAVGWPRGLDKWSLIVQPLK